MGPGVSRRVDTRRAAERVDGEAGVVGECPMSELDGRFRGFLAGIADEGVGILDNVEAGVELIETADRHPRQPGIRFPRGANQVGEFAPLFLVSRAENQGQAIKLRHRCFAHS